MIFGLRTSDTYQKAGLRKSWALGTRTSFVISRLPCKQLLLIPEGRPVRQDLACAGLVPGARSQDVASRLGPAFAYGTWGCANSPWDASAG